jgi:hypothetical protein
MHVFHEPSGITYCDQHWYVVSAEGCCPRCDTELTPSPWVDFHCLVRWIQRVEPDATRWTAIKSVRRIVMQGQRRAFARAAPGCAYYSHPQWPHIVVVVKAETNAAVTVLVDAEAA